MPISEAILNGTMTEDPELVKESENSIMRKLIKLYLPHLNSQAISDFYNTIKGEGKLDGLSKIFERLDMKENKMLPLTNL